MANTISLQKAKSIIQLWNGTQNINIRGTARQLKISRNTLKRYLLELRSPDLSHAGVLTIAVFRNGRYWSNKKRLREKRLTYTKWKDCLIEVNDRATLLEWSKSKLKRRWEKAVVLLEAHNGRRADFIAEKIECSVDHVRKLIRKYRKGGLTALTPTRKKNTKIITVLKEKKEKLIRLLHESPAIHNVNRTSWSLKTLEQVYNKKHDYTISKTSISKYLQDEG